jgi:hypothetical protein
MAVPEIAHAVVSESVERRTEVWLAAPLARLTGIAAPLGGGVFGPEIKYMVS